MAPSWPLARRHEERLAKVRNHLFRLWRPTFSRIVRSLTPKRATIVRTPWSREALVIAGSSCSDHTIRVRTVYIVDLTVIEKRLLPWAIATKSQSVCSRPKTMPKASNRP
ncbi:MULTISPECIES: hypothetical protein [Sinorhizobium]|uniref:Uncharacterized protein n=1 Tax=Sinorhizobium americanum TaxID=194963 RepID=A0A2S3YK90_9HYPH|nr:MULTISPECIES: hypothetical protein [Sinorhizobium]POH27766.1 hypothetical protein ATY31_22100 [Sinorhizobium americanum]POH29341.1 hypothetical protein ATY30_17135 [Sinorhizobium americanum]